MESSVAISVSNLDVPFGDRTGLRDLSFDVASGEKVLICGPSGSGKSTLLGVLLGFAFPSAGVVRILGQELNDDTVWSLRRQFAYVPQEPDFGEGSVRETLERPLHYRANSHLARDESTYKPLLDLLRLPSGTLEKSVTDLSGGEKQRVGLVAALMLRRPLLLADEITSALDPELTSVVVDYLGRQEDVALLAACHTPESLPLGGRVVSLDGERS